MMRNADYIMSNYIIDELGLAKKAQVGVDLTVNRVTKIGGIGDKVDGVLYNDTTAAEIGVKADFATYTEIFPTSTYNTHHDGEISMFVLPIGVYSIEFDQGLKPLGNEDTAFIHHRSTVLRNGNVIKTAVYDPGFGTDKMGAIMFINVPMKIQQHARVAQIVMHSNQSAELYDGSYNNERDFR